MDIMELGAIGELVGGAAVLVTLAYLATQVRQNTRAIRLETVHNLTEEFRDWNKVIAANEGVADIFLRGLQTPETLEGPEKLRHYCLLYSVLSAFENAYIQQRAGALDPDGWAGMERSIIDFSKLPGVQTYWKERKHWYGEGFSRYMDNRVISAPASAGYRPAGT